MPTSEAKRAKWLAHAVAAAKQSGLDYLPAIEDPLPLEEFAATGGPGIYGDLATDARPIAEVLRSLAAGGPQNLERSPAAGGAQNLERSLAAGESQKLARSLAVVVGPEGGLTEAERAALRAGGFTPVRLGRTTLRIETAAVAILAAVAAICE